MDRSYEFDDFDDEDLPSAEDLDAIIKGEDAPDETGMEWDFPVIHIGTKGKRKRVTGANGWDGADLAELREKLKQNLPGRVGVDMTNVQFPASGTFGEMIDWAMKGSAILLINPHPRVQQMLWFRSHCSLVGDNLYLLQDNAVVPTQEETRSDVNGAIAGAVEKNTRKELES